MATQLEGHPEITKQEEKELHRVFDYLANHTAKAKVMVVLQPKLDRRSTMDAHAKSAAAIKVMDLKTGRVMSEEEIEAEREVIEEEIEVLQAQVDGLGAEGGKKVAPTDLSDALAKLGRHVSKKVVADMIWEVDEDLDGAVSWDEFVLLFQRNIADKSGLEPNQLFNAVQFMMYDKDFSGTVTVDECMSMLYARYGGDNLEEALSELFGDSLSTADGGAELTFDAYLNAVNKRQEAAMIATTPFAKREAAAKKAMGGGKVKAGGRK